MYVQNCDLGIAGHQGNKSHFGQANQAYLVDDLYTQLDLLFTYQPWTGFLPKMIVHDL